MCLVCEDGQELGGCSIERNENKEYNLIIETSEWNDYTGSWVREEVTIYYCPFCGNKLN